MCHVVLANANHWFLCVPLVSPLSSLQVRVFEESKWIKSPLLVVALEAPALPLSAYPLLVRESIVLTGCTLKWVPVFCLSVMLLRVFGRPSFAFFLSFLSCRDPYK